MNDAELPRIENELFVNISPKTVAATVAQEDAKPIEISGGIEISSLAFLADERRILAGHDDGKVRLWGVEGGHQVRVLMDEYVYSITVSPDGNWIVFGAGNGRVIVLNAETYEKVMEYKGHNERVYALDISRDSTRIASGSDDYTACIWSLSNPTSQLLGPLKHTYWVAAIKFSPNNQFFVTATWMQESVRIYDSQNGHLLVDYAIFVGSFLNQSICWSNDGEQLVVVSINGNINSVDVATRTTLFKWPIHSEYSFKCISLANDDTFIAASADSSVSFWDTTTQEQIGPVIKHIHDIRFMAISTNYDLMTAGYEKITFHNLCDILPSPYRDHMLRIREENAAFFKALKPTSVLCELNQDWRLEQPLSLRRGDAALTGAPASFLHPRETGATTYFYLHQVRNPHYPCFKGQTLL